MSECGVDERASECGRTSLSAMERAERLACGRLAGWLCVSVTSLAPHRAKVDAFKKKLKFERNCGVGVGAGACD